MSNAKMEYDRVIKSRKPNRLAEIKMLNKRGLKGWELYATFTRTKKEGRSPIRYAYFFRRKILK